jgi:hypothetical protein
MIRKAAGFYSIIIGVSVLGMWSATLLTGGISEGPIEIAFHLASEFLMAILLLISGIALLRGKTYGEKAFLVSNGMLIYSVLNAAGYFWQRNDFIMPCFLCSSLLYQ